MQIKDLLKHTIIQTEDINISVYHVLIVLVVLVATRLLLWFIRRLFNRQVKRNILEKGKGAALYQIVRYTLWIIAITIGLETVGIKVTILLASSAALLVGLGLGIQKVFMDFVSGIVILFEGTIKVEDIVELENGTIGKVIEISLRTSKIRTRDSIIQIVPNSMFINENVINWSHMEMLTRFNVEVGVAYGSDVELVKNILIESASEHPKIAKSPTPIVQFADFGESSLNFKLLFWTDETFFVEMTKSDLRYTINNKFREKNVTIPFPQRDVNLKQN
ncbi:MAG: mechanosensitive ion channel [Bacteroidales bacterium]|nr:mechanosensitive ion channel [Bacteroidales bacterium]